MKNQTAIVLFLLGVGCSHMDRHSFQVPKEGFRNVVQQARESEKRQENPLYLPNRRVEAEEFGTEALKSLISSMHQTMQQKTGIGISANQVGKNIQAFIIEAKPNNPRYKVLGPVPYAVFLNPRIVAASRERRNFWHACLSAVGEKRGNVATYEWIDVEASDPNGQPVHTRLTGLAAVIFQHEFRHMLGGTYLDRATTYLTKEEFDQSLDRKEIPFFEPADENLPLLVGDYRIGETLEEYYARTRKL